MGKFLNFLYEEDEKEQLALPPIQVGDTVLVGRFKNRKATVTGFDTDKNGQPILKTNKGPVTLFKPRLANLLPTKEDEPLQDDAQPRVIIDKGW